jgi:integrase
VHYGGRHPKVTGKDGLHVVRHTAATWLMQAGVDAFEAAGYLGMSVETLLEVYGHHRHAFQEKAARASDRRSKFRRVDSRKARIVHPAQTC